LTMEPFVLAAHFSGSRITRPAINLMKKNLSF